jgi:dihydropteroate synthase
MDKKTLINCGGQLLDLSQPAVMGIINITSDSFYDGSRFREKFVIIHRAECILEEGGAIIDLGAYSSRPGAENISVEEELLRLRFAMGLIRENFPKALVSIDTFRAEIVAKLYDEFGAFIVNDISAGEIDANMIPEVARLKLPYIAMHMRGTPQTMHKFTKYEDVTMDVIRYFIDKIKQLRDADVTDIIIDPGFGFAKTLDDNYELLARLADFKTLGLPVLVGVSRKSMFYKQLDVTPADVLAATLSANTVAMLNGADILRVHDVKEAVQAVMVVEKVKKFAHNNQTVN